MADGIVRAKGGSSCPSCWLKTVAHVRQVNVPVLVVGSDIAEQGGVVGVVAVSVVVIESMGHFQKKKILKKSYGSFPLSGIANVVALT